MGIEAQLFYVKLHGPTPYGELKKMLVKLGCSEADNFGILGKGFEIVSSEGITEILLHTDKNGNVSEMSVRFSLLNPETVVYQTLNFLKLLAKLIPCDIYVAEPQRKIDQINPSVLQNLMIEKIRHFVKMAGGHQKPIRAGNETFDYIQEENRRNSPQA